MSTRTRWRGSRRVASIPSVPGIRMSIRITSGRWRSAARDRLLAVVGLGDDLDHPGRLEHGLEAGPHQRLVVGDQDADHGRTGAPRGPRSRGRRAGRRRACRRTRRRARACRSARGRRRSLARALAVVGDDVSSQRPRRRSGRSPRRARRRRGGSRSSPPPARSGTRTRRAPAASARGAPSTVSVIGTPAARAPSSTPSSVVEPRLRRRAASSRSTCSVRCSSPIVRRPSAAIASARSSPVTAASASACTTISDTSWPTASCSSRAIRSRSSVAAASASSSRSRAAAPRRSTVEPRRARSSPAQNTAVDDRLEPVVHARRAARATITTAAPTAHHSPRSIGEPVQRHQREEHVRRRERQRDPDREDHDEDRDRVPAQHKAS